MHINSAHLGKELSKAERKHMQECDVCAFEHDLLAKLKYSSEEMSLETPPSFVWEGIQRSGKIPKSQRNRLWQAVTGLAATILICGLLFNNYQLQGQLEQVLLVNQSLELQIIQDSAPTFRQAKLLTKIRKIDLQLLEATVASDKLVFLKERQKLITEMVRSQKGGDYEFSI